MPGAPGEGLVDDALDRPVSVVRLPPGADRFGFLATVAGRGLRSGVPASRPRPRAEPRGAVGAGGVPFDRCGPTAAVRLRRTGLPVAFVADDRRGSAASSEWARAAGGGCVVVGARAAAWAPAPGLTLAVVVDEHDEALQEERVPTWHARDVVLERARRAGAVAVLLSVPSLEALDAGALLVPPRRVERAGWPVLDIVDRRREDPATASSLVSSHLAGIALGQVGWCACSTARAAPASWPAGPAVSWPGARRAAPRSSSRSPACCAAGGAARSAGVCLACGSTAMRVAPAGVGRVREELELLGERVAEVTAAGGDDGLAARVVIGTEGGPGWAGPTSWRSSTWPELTAPLPRRRAGPRPRRAPAARLLGGREATGRLVVQTRLPTTPVLDAVVQAPDACRLGDRRAAVAEALSTAHGRAGAGGFPARHRDVRRRAPSGRADGPGGAGPDQQHLVGPGGRPRGAVAAALG